MEKPDTPQEAAAEPTRAPEPRTANGPLPPPAKGRTVAIVGAGAIAGAALAGMLTRDDPGQRPQPDAEERRQPQAGGRGTRSLDLTPGSYDAAAHTVEAVLSVGSPVTRYYFVEELEISSTAIDLTRVTGGVCPILDSHNQGDTGAQVGRLVEARIEGGQLVGLIQFDQTDAGQALEARVARGELRAISIGYQVTTWQITSTPGSADLETWRAVSWQLLEASFVTVPADPNAVVRSAPGNAHGTTHQENDMYRNAPGGGVAHPNANRGAAPETPAADTTVVVEPNGETRTEPHGHAPVTPLAAPAPAVTASRISDLCGRSTALGSDFALELIRANETTPMNEAQLLARVNERLLDPSRHTIDARAGAAGHESEGFRQAMEDAVTLRANPSLRLEDVAGRTHDQRVADAREFRGMTMMEMARDYCGRTNVTIRGLGRMEIAGAALGMQRYGALTTSDFANALSTASNKRVRAAFTAAPQTFRPIISTDTLPDFKPTQLVGLGDAPSLLVVPENAEFKRGGLTDTGLFYNLTTYGRIIAITRQAIVNDDQSLFSRIPTMFGRKAADLESDLVWGIVISNPTMSDGYALFSTQHGNLMTGSAITIDSIGLATQAMRQQTSAEGGYLSIQPSFLIVGPAKEAEARKLFFVDPQLNGNYFSSTLTLIVEPRITGNQWFLAADPAAFDTIVLAHLLGQEELFTDTRVGFDVDGIENKARLDVGAAAIDWRGLVKNPGN
ncbi:prohead protease/major capsid protein fusion protein [Sphingomonas nostoxanthinifaciens]|uniref:prohead protease/major capsid protein fusion protein n=1 Tax=Sphingomonas nostoxanthinifaciens TaxID=2872652 RepID=UPI001CC1F38B|nr:prohead protease/major capsid protein fusion protein [Sphingomonas nostoxanthinifaciens]UAK24191.1 Mu-like prophage major head subunit gpT family protein [Sphingomonas nostoxanthinifaciens]